MKRLVIVHPFAMLVAVMLALASVGCETSKAFQTGVAAGGPRISQHATAYLNADQSTEPTEKSLRTAQLGQFQVATTQQPIKFRPVYDSWASVRPWFVQYGNADTALQGNPTKAMLRTDMVAAFDKVVEAERKRRSIWFPFDSVPPIQK